MSTSTAAGSSSSPSPAGSTSISSSLNLLSHNYARSTPARVKLIDTFLLLLVLSGVAQFAYRILVTSYPFNAFLAGFGGSVGQFVLFAGLRSQVALGRDQEFKKVSQERAFADFCAASVVLHFFMYNFLG